VQRSIAIPKPSAPVAANPHRAAVASRLQSEGQPVAQNEEIKPFDLEVMAAIDP